MHMRHIKNLEQSEQMLRLENSLFAVPLPRNVPKKLSCYTFSFATVGWEGGLINVHAVKHDWCHLFIKTTSGKREKWSFKAGDF